MEWDVAVGQKGNWFLITSAVSDREHSSLLPSPPSLPPCEDLVLVVLPSPCHCRYFKTLSELSWSSRGVTAQLATRQRTRMLCSVPMSRAPASCLSPRSSSAGFGDYLSPFEIRLGTLICDDLLVHLRPMPPSLFLFVSLNDASSFACSHGLMEAPLETHLDPVWQQLSECLRGRMGARDSYLP